jgi:general stress protein 26
VKKTTAERDPKAVHRLRELIADISVAMLTTVTAEGALRSRPMVTQQIREEGELWFFLSDDSGKARDLSEEHAVNVAYADPAKQRYVSVSGNAAIVHDSEMVHDLWKPEYERYFPRGLDDPHLALLCVRIETAEYWDLTAGRMVEIGGRPPEPRATGGANGDPHTRIDIRATPSSG